MKTIRNYFEVISKSKLFKRNYYSLIFILGLSLTFHSSCKKSEVIEQKSTDSEQIIKAKLLAAGFDLSQGFSKYGDKYIVENDIILSVEEINNLTKERNTINLFGKGIGSDINNNGSKSKDKTSHFVGNNLLTISSGVRTIYIYMPTTFGTYMQNSLDSAINRYNALELGLVFSKTTSSSSADISIASVYIDPFVDPNSSYLMAAGFPSAGSPYNQILINTYYYNTSNNRVDAISTLAHEIGHTIGFRHTDYMNRAFSCGAVTSGNNEGTNTMGANQVTATSVNTSDNRTNDSWMLACSNGTDRLFTETDIISLLEIYPRKKTIYVKEIRGLIGDDSWTDGVNDYEYISWDILVQFFEDAALTIPYTTTNYLLLHVYGETAYSYSESRMLVPPGYSTFYVDTYARSRKYTYGNLVQDNSSGYQTKGGSGYYGPYPWP